jgi:hypothetical protein
MSDRTKSARLALTGVIASTLLSLPLAAIAAEPRAVVELFTSQGCDSCPPADRLAGELAKDPTLIMLSLAVDYWDYIGWKDTLALPGHGNRQRAYSRSRGDRNVFTPQVVVNGAAQARGSDKGDIDRAIAQSRTQPSVLMVPVSLTLDDGKLTAKVPAGKTGSERADVWLCPIMKTVPVEITRGENKGHTFTYHNVVRRWIKLGEWTGAAQSWSLPVKDFQTDGVDEVAVLVQSGSTAAPGPMLAAGMLALK